MSLRDYVKQYKDNLPNFWGIYRYYEDYHRPDTVTLCDNCRPIWREKEDNLMTEWLNDIPARRSPEALSSNNGLEVQQGPLPSSPTQSSGTGEKDNQQSPDTEQDRQIFRILEPIRGARIREGSTLSRDALDNAYQLMRVFVTREQHRYAADRLRELKGREEYLRCERCTGAHLIRAIRKEQIDGAIAAEEQALKGESDAT